MFIPIDLTAVEESKPVPAGVYNLQILEADLVISQKGNPQFSLVIGIDGHDSAPNLRHFISIPKEDDEPRAREFKSLLLKRFLTLFRLPIPREIDTEKMAMEMPGATARAELTLSEPDESGNVYNRLVVPRLTGEARKVSGQMKR